MSKPTLASYATSGYDATTPKTVTVTVNTGDLLVVVGSTENNNCGMATPVATGVTFTLQRSIIQTNYTAAYEWTGVATTTGSLTISVSRTGSSGLFWGFGVYRFSAHGGVGASAAINASGAPSLALTTTGPNSSVIVLNSDWNSIDGVSRVWLTGAGSFTEENYFRDAARLAVYSGFHADAGAAGSKTVGLSAPTGQKYSLMALEVLGVAGGTAPVANAGADQAAIEPLSTVTLSGSGTNSPTAYQWTQTAGTTVTLSSTTVQSPTFTAPANANGETLTFSLVASNATGSSSPDTVNVVVLPQLEWLLNAAGVWKASKTTLL